MCDIVVLPLSSYGVLHSKIFTEVTAPKSRMSASSIIPAYERRLDAATSFYFLLHLIYHNFGHNTTPKKKYYIVQNCIANNAYSLEHRRHSDREEKTILAGEAAYGRNGLALFSSGGQAGIWLSRFGANISVGDVSLCYCLQRCCPENGSKIDMAVNLLDSLPETNARIILEMDSWYTCKRLWDKALQKEITLIGAMKTNRILYPDGHRHSAQEYAPMLPNGQYHLVTVGGHEYWIHRLQGVTDRSFVPSLGIRLVSSNPSARILIA